MKTHVRLTADSAALLVVDIQEKLVAAIPNAPLVIANASRLIRAANAIGIPVLATEQYPRGLGSTVEPLREMLPDRLAKTSFSALGAPDLPRRLSDLGVRHVAVCGIETHVCIAQTAIDLRAHGYQVQVPADGVASRSQIDETHALRRMEQEGIVVTTVEAILFEWVATSEHPAFKQISALVKDVSPPASC